MPDAIPLLPVPLTLTIIFRIFPRGVAPVYRSLLLLSAFALVLGCKKGDTNKAAGPPDAESGGPNASKSDTAALPKIQARVKLNLAAELATFEPAVQLSDDGKAIAVACRDSKSKTSVKVWAAAGEPKEAGEFDSSGRFALSPSGRFLVTSGTLFEPTVYEVATKKAVAKLPLIFSHAYFRDDSTVVATTRSYNFPVASKGRIVVWDVTKNADAGSFDIPDNRFETALPARSGKEIWLFMSKDKFEVECYDVAEKKLLRTIQPENNTGRPFTSSGIWHSIAADASVFTTTLAKTNVFDATTGKIAGGLPENIWASATGLLPSGTRYLARAGKSNAGLSESDYVMYDWRAKKNLAVLTGHSGGQKEPPQSAASRDGKTLVSVTKNGEGLVYDISSVK